MNAGSPEGRFGSELAAALTELRLSPVAQAECLFPYMLLDHPACKQNVVQATPAGAGRGFSWNTELACSRMRAKSLVAKRR